VEFLNPELKIAFVGVKLPETVAVCTNVINGLYNNILRFALKYMPQYFAPQLHKTHKDPDAMDINTGTLKYAPLESVKQE